MFGVQIDRITVATSPAAVASEALDDQIALADLLFKQQFQWLFQRPRAA